MKKALICRDNIEGHEPIPTTDRFAAFLKDEGYDVRIETANLEVYTDEAYMSTVDIIISCFTLREITHEQSMGLANAVKNGAGLAGWHGGLGDAFRMDSLFQFMVGGQFVNHPGGCIDYMVNIVDKNDPITAGLNDFQMTDTEQYYMHVDPSVQVLATTTFIDPNDPDVNGVVMPFIWKRNFGKGRVFYSAVGHTNKDFDVEESRIIMERGILWASR